MVCDNETKFPLDWNLKDMFLYHFRCRIVGYNGLDGLFVVSLEKYGIFENSMISLVTQCYI